MTAKQSQDSNAVGLRYAREASIGVLPASPIWKPLEPNSFADFGGELTLLARDFIEPSRQRRKGVITDLNAAGGFNTDLTQENMQEVLESFFFAALRKKLDVVAPTITAAGDDFALNSGVKSAVVAAGGTGYVVGDILTLVGGTSSVVATVTVTGVTGGIVDSVSPLVAGVYTAVPVDPVATSGGTGTSCTLTVTWDSETYVVNDLLFAKNFDDDANNGLHLVTGVPTESLVAVTTALVDASTQTGTVSHVGFQFATGDVDIDVTGTYPKIVAAAKDLEDLGLIVGEYVFLGGDLTAEKFANTENNGFKRVRSISTTEIEFDKSESTMVAETGTGLTVRIFFGRVLKNETGDLIVRNTLQLERTLGAPDDALPASLQSEYMLGGVASELTLNVGAADKVHLDIGFLGLSMEQRTGTTGVKSGARPALTEADAFNTSSDFSRIKMSQVVSGDEAPTALFAFLEEWTITLNNNIVPNKAVGTLGAFEMTTGTFQVGGSLTAYFADIAAVTAVNANADITLDFTLVKSNAGITFDLPLIALGDGRPAVTKNEPIKLPLTSEAATGAKIDSALNHTMLMVFWDYLPTLADT